MYWSRQYLSIPPAVGFVAKRKTNQLEKFKKESAGTQRNEKKYKWNVQRMFLFM